MSFKHFVVCLLASMLSPTCLAGCPPHAFTDPSQLKIDSDRVLLVVHASATYDARYATKRGVDAAVRFAKNQRIPVIYLQDESGDPYYFMDDCQPDHWVYSNGGEISFDISRPRHIYVAGGHLELCLYASLNEVLYQWGRAAPVDRHITYLMDAVYSNGKFVDPSDPFYRDFDRFLGIVTYGRPGGEHWPKLTLLETMGIILKEEHEYDYLKQVLPRRDRSMPPSYRIEVGMNGSANRTLRPAKDLLQPRLSFHFVDSALNALSPDCMEKDSCQL